MRRAGRLRDMVLRKILGIDPRTLASNVSKTRRSIDRDTVTSARFRAAIDLRFDEVNRALRDLQDRLRSLDDNAKQIVELRSVFTQLADSLQASGLSQVAEISAKVDSVRGSVMRLQGLAGSARDDIPRLRSELAEARKQEAYERAFTEPEPLVSVRIAAYQNTKALMDRAIYSVLQQTYQNFEIIVVNDGPNAATRDAISSLNDPRIEYVEFPFRRSYPEKASDRWMVAGAPGMNEGARRASGNWIAPLDDDDEFGSDHIEFLLDLARTRRAELVYGALDRLDEISGEREHIFAFPPQRGGFSFQGALYHSGLRFFEYDEESWRLGEPGDWNLCRRMMSAGVRICGVDRIVGNVYRVPFADKEDDR